MRGSTVVLVMVLLGAGSAMPATADTPAIVVAYRFDDYNGNVIDNVDMGILRVFREHRLRCTFAAIPNFNYVPLSREKLDILKKAVEEGEVDAAQHGWTHNVLDITHGRESDYGSEFKGVMYGEQSERIRRGKEFLEQGLGMPMTVFVPPYNSYDFDTVQAIETLGFSCLSASLGSDIPPATKLKLAPDTVGLEGVHAAVDMARRHACGTPALIVILGHAFEFKRYGSKSQGFEYARRGYYTLEKLSETLDWLQAQKDVRVLSLGQVLDEDKDLGAQRFMANRAVYLQFDRVPSFLRPSFPQLVYFSTDRAEAIQARWTTCFGLFYGGTAAVAAAVAFFFAWIAFPRIGWGKWVLIGLVAALLAGAFAWSGPRGFHSWREIFAVVVLAGAWLGLVLGLLRRRRAAA